MNNVDGKKKPVPTILPDAALVSLGEPNRAGEMQSNEALRELLRKSNYFKESFSLGQNDLDLRTNHQQQLDLYQMMSNLNNLNTINNSGLNNLNAGLNASLSASLNDNLNTSLLSTLLSSSNSLLDNGNSNDSLLSEAIAQLLSPKNLEDALNRFKLNLLMMRQHQIITNSLNNEKSSLGSFGPGQTLDRDNLLTNVVLDESLNSVLSNNSVASSALKGAEHSADRQTELNELNDQNDDTRSSVDRFEKSAGRTERQSNGERIISDDSNQSVIALDEHGRQELGELAARQRPANLSESMNSTSSSLNLANNQFNLLNTLKLSTLQTLANPLYPLNQLNLAGLTGGNLNLNLNLNQPIIDQNKQNPQPSVSGGCIFDQNNHLSI